MDGNETTLQVLVPKETKKALRLRVAETGETMREVVLKALSREGITVAEEAIVDRRRKR